MKTRYRIAITLFLYVALMLVEIPFFLTKPKSQPVAPDLPNGWHVLVNLLLKGGGNTPNLIVITIYLACFKQKHRAYLHVLLYMAQLFLSFTMRSFFQRPRPYMQFYIYCTDGPDTCNEPFQPWTCKASFSSPSLHALSCTAITVYLLLDFLITRDEIKQVSRYQADDTGQLVELPPLHSTGITNFWAVIIFLVGLAYTFAVCILQWGLGVSYLNQLVWGWLLGIWLAFSFAFIIRSPLHNYFIKLLEDRQEITQQWNHTAKVALLTLIMLSFSLIQYFSYKHIWDDETNQPPYKDYLEHLKPFTSFCTSFGTSVYKTKTNLFGVDFEYSSAYICILTSYLGIMYQRNNYKGQLFIDVHPFDSNLKQFARFIARCAVMAFIGGILYFIVDKTTEAIQKSKSPIGVWEIYFALIMVPYSLGSFLSFAFGDFVCLKLKLYTDSDVYALDQSRTSIQSITDYLDDQNSSAKLSMQKSGAMNMTISSYGGGSLDISHGGSSEQIRAQTF